VAAIVLVVILAPFVLFNKHLNDWTLEWMHADNAQRWWVGTAAVGLLAVDIVLPVPSSLVSTVLSALAPPWFSGGFCQNLRQLGIQGCTV